MPNINLASRQSASGSGSPSVPSLPGHWELGNVANVYTPNPVFVRADVAGSYTFIPASDSTATPTAAVTMTLAAGEVIGMVKQVTVAAGTFHVGI